MQGAEERRPGQVLIPAERAVHDRQLRCRRGSGTGAHGEQADGERDREDEPSHETPPIQPPITRLPCRMTL